MASPPPSWIILGNVARVSGTDAGADDLPQGADLALALATPPRVTLLTVPHRVSPDRTSTRWSSPSIHPACSSSPRPLPRRRRPRSPPTQRTPRSTSTSTTSHRARAPHRRLPPTAPPTARRSRSTSPTSRRSRALPCAPTRSTTSSSPTPTSPPTPSSPPRNRYGHTMKGLSTHGVGKNVFQLEGWSRTNLWLELWRRMRDRVQWPMTKRAPGHRLLGQAAEQHLVHLKVEVLRITRRDVECLQQSRDRKVQHLVMKTFPHHLVL